MPLPFWLQVKFEVTAFQNDVPRRVPFYVIISWIKYEDILKLYISFNNNDEYEICFGQTVGINFDTKPLLAVDERQRKGELAGNSPSELGT